MTTNEVIKSVKELLKDAVADTCHIVITGGEPLCQQDSLIDLIAGMRSQGMWNPITIETNGTLVPLSKLLLDSRVFWSVSPKLSTSCHFEGTDIPKARQEAHKSKRINLDALATIIYENTNDYQLKFVYSGEDSLSEIYDIIARLNDALIDRYGTRAEYCVECLDQHIMLMPEGAAIQQLEAKSKETVDACIRTGWKFCDRLHIRIWNDKRGV
jgi:7-carboxy-7-deazaguanine synthase